PVGATGTAARQGLDVTRGRGIVAQRDPAHLIQRASAGSGLARSPVLNASAAAVVNTCARASVSRVRARARLRWASRTSGYVASPCSYDERVAVQLFSDAARSAAPACCRASATFSSLYAFHTSRTALSRARVSSSEATSCADSARLSRLRRSKPSNNVHSKRSPASHCWASTVSYGPPRMLTRPMLRPVAARTPSLG